MAAVPVFHDTVKFGDPDRGGMVGGKISNINSPERR